MRFFSLFIPLYFWCLLGAARAEKPVLAVAPLTSPDFASAVTKTISAKLVELARDSGAFAVFDQDDIATVLQMQKQGASPVVADPVAFGRLVAARKVLTSDLRRAGQVCSLGLKITDVETGLVEAAKLEVGECLLPALLERTVSLWRKLVTGTVTIATTPPKLRVKIDGGAPMDTPVTLGLAIGTHEIALDAPGYRAASAVVTVRYQEQSAISLEGTLQRTGRLQLTGAPLGAAVYDGPAQLGTLPLDIELAAGLRTLRIVTDLGEHLRAVTIPSDQRVALRVVFPFAALQNFERHFVAANEAGRAKRHAFAEKQLEAALQAGLLSMQALPAELQPELAAALHYAEGARALTQAWLLQSEAQAGAGLDVYCNALENAAKRFAEAAAALPKTRVLNLAANHLAGTRAPLKLGVCEVEARFPHRLREINWPTALPPDALRSQAESNRTLVQALKQQTSLSAQQREWVAMEEALLLAYERLSTMAALKDELLKAPAVTLPRFCALQKQTLGYAATAQKRLEGVRDAAFPLAERLSAIEDMRRRAQSDGTLCGG